jgi:hypothetical protein
MQERNHIYEIYRLQPVVYSIVSELDLQHNIQKEDKVDALVSLIR